MVLCQQFLETGTGAEIPRFLSKNESLFLRRRQTWLAYMPFPTPTVISHLGKSLLRSTSCSEELVHFFYFSLGFDGANTISDPENSLNLSSASTLTTSTLTICLTDCLCLAGLTRDRATIACHEMLADAHQIENTLPAKEHMNSTNSMNSTYSMNSSNSMNNMDLQELLNLC